MKLLALVLSLVAGPPRPPLKFRVPGAPLRPGGLVKSTPQASERFVTDLRDRDSRVGFIRKVYGLLGGQLAVTLGAILWASSHKQIVVPFLRSPGGGAALSGATVASVGCSLLIGLRPSLQSSLGGVGVLGLFTLCEAFIVAMVSSLYASPSVLLAVAQTAAVTTGLSLYALQPDPRFDLSSLGSLLGAGTLVLLSASLLTLSLGFGAGDVALSSAAALLAAGFIVLDTKRICDGSHPSHSLRSHQYVAGAMALYTDVASLFLHLLRLFGERDDKGGT